MVTAEDYQIGPLSTSQEIVKAKSVNRTSSGISRNFDLSRCNWQIFYNEYVWNRRSIFIKELFAQLKTRI